MVSHWVQSALDNLRRRMAMVVGRGVLEVLTADDGLMRAKIAGIADEVLEGREYVLDYGISTRPFPEAEALMLFLAGLRSNGVVVRLFDRRYTLALDYGEVALHDDLGQVVHLTRSGVKITSPLDVTVEAGETLRLKGRDVQIHAERRLDVDAGGYGYTWIAADGSYDLTNYVIGPVISATVAVAPPEVPHG